MSTPPIPPGGLRLSEGPMEDSAPDDPNVAVLRRFFDALERGDDAGLRELLDPEVVQTVSGRSVLAGAYAGPAAVSGLAARMRGLLDRPPEMTPLIWLAAGPHAHVVARIELARGPRTLSTQQAMVFALAGGRITTIRDYQDDQYAFDEFWDAVTQIAGRDRQDEGGR